MGGTQGEGTLQGGTCRRTAHANAAWGLQEQHGSVRAWRSRRSLTCATASAGRLALRCNLGGGGRVCAATQVWRRAALGAFALL